MKKVLILALTLCMSIGLCACGSGSQSESTGESSESSETTTAVQEEASDPIVIKLAHGSSENEAQHIGWLKFEELLESRSDGNIQVELYPAGQLGADRELIESTQTGDIQACSPSSSPLAGFAQEFYALDIPFLFTDRDMAYEVLDGEVGQQLLDTLDNYGLKGLGYMENGFRNLTNSRNEVVLPEDAKGLKIRTMENKIHMAFWQNIGVSATPMAFGEVFTALQQKTIEGQENPYEIIYSGKFYEVQPYITETQHIYTPYIVLFNKDFYEGLSDENRALIEEVLAEAIEYERETAATSEEEKRQLMLG